MQLAIYISDNTDITLIDNIVKLYEDDMPFLTLDSQCQNHKLSITEFCCINFAHLSYYKDKIVFLNHENFNKRAGDLICKKIVVTSKENLIKLDKTLMNDVDVFICDSSKKIRKAKNAEIKSVLR